MTFISELRGLTEALACFPDLDVEPEDLPSVIEALPDDAVAQIMGGTADMRRCLDLVAVIAAGVAARRSTRDRGHGGMAAVRGHRTPVAMIQAITGGTASDAKRAVQVGESLLDRGEVGASVAGDGVGGGTDAGGSSGAPGGRDGGGDGGDGAAGADATLDARGPWHEPLRQARLRNALTSEQFDAIRRNLGEPPVSDDPVQSAAAHEVWSIAAEQLVADAAAMPVEELRRRAKTMRDQLDPAGAEARFAARFETRDFRMYVDADDRWVGRIHFDDEMAMWVRSMMDAGLRPRRGGPRFMTDEERATAADLLDDPRTNEQLAYDLFMDVLRAGAVANAAEVFGTRQPGVRMVVVKDAVGPLDQFGRMLATGHAEDGGDPLPGSVIDRNVCMNGSVEVTVDPEGNPLDVGREQRAFTTPQRKALAVRDGGCPIPGCCTPASYCEAHHCDHWWEDHGRTDIDRGILLCKFHHLWLHNKGYKITRDGHGPFVLHRPPEDGGPLVLKSKAPWSWAWNPPPPPTRPGWRQAPTPAPSPTPATAPAG